MDEKQVNQLNFDMLNGQEKHIQLPYKQIVVIIESLYNFKTDIENNMSENTLGKMRFEDKLEDVNYLIEVLETGAEYNFHRRLEKCKIKKVKNDDAGMELKKREVKDCE